MGVRPDFLDNAPMHGGAGRDFAGFNAIYVQFIEAPFPARTPPWARSLGDFLVEIDAVAALP